jgi:predicted TIM-barrel fold metal-dependent hydrolase
MIFDAHLHIIDPAFPLVDNQGYRPPPYTVADYRARAAALGIAGGAIVAGSFQGFGQTWLLAALAALGPGFVGVAQIAPETGDDEIDRLAAAGVRALRFNLKRGGAMTAADIERLARRAFARAGWHAEFYAGADALNELAPLLARLPAAAVDHLGLEAAALPTLLRLAAAGVRVKATGFGRLDFAAGPAIRQLHAANPQALMFGSDLPSTRAARPFSPADLALVRDTLGEADADAVLWKNARQFYRIAAQTS